jgi:hypothetical protein
MSRETELLTEIRDLLAVIAEPALAARDTKLRSSLRAIVGSGSKKAKAALLFDGTRSRAEIAKESGIDPSDLTKLIKALGAAQLVSAEDKHPKLYLRIPPTFFDGSDVSE